MNHSGVETFQLKVTGAPVFSSSSSCFVGYCRRVTCRRLVISRCCAPATFLVHENRCSETSVCSSSLWRPQPFAQRLKAEPVLPVPQLRSIHSHSNPCFSHYMFPALGRSPDSLPSCRAASRPLGETRGSMASHVEREGRG